MPHAQLEMRNGASRLSQVVLTAPRRLQSLRFLPLRRVRWRSSTPTSPIIRAREWSTPLAKTIANAIEVTGPISIASYMRQCLTNPDGGYYTTTRTASDQFGKRGDFITSPEISQVFGELIGIWFMTEWMSQGRPKNGVQFMEVGPGRGTLMADLLRTIGQFRAFCGAIEGVWLVEAGEGLRMQQQNVLCGEDAQAKKMTDDEGRMWWECASQYGNGIPIRWVEDIALLPDNQANGAKTPFIIAHEFFDALPIHAFESVAPAPSTNQTELLDRDGNPMVRQNRASKLPQWRELLVTPTRQSLTLKTPTEYIQPMSKKPEPDFHLTLAKASNPSSLVLPEHPRYRALKQRPGSRVEISPESIRYVQDFARRIGYSNVTRPKASSSTASYSKSKGAALIIDYGPDSTVPIDSLRGIKSHSIISPFLYAGETDISADVNFNALADAALEASEQVEVHGPVQQGTWLNQLGIKERAEKLMHSLKGNDPSIEQKRKDLEIGWKRLIEGGPKGMGKAYKVMAIVPENGGKRRPVGFGGDVAM